MSKNVVIGDGLSTMYEEEDTFEESDNSKYTQSDSKTTRGYTNQKNNWTKEEDDQLRELILVKRLSNWDRISEIIEKSPKDCCKR